MSDTGTGGDAAAGNTGAGGSSSPAGAVGGAGSGENSAPPSRPEYIEEKFWDGKQVRVEDLAKSYREIQGKFSTRMDDLKKIARTEVEQERFKARPAKLEDYKLTPSKPDDFKNFAIDEKSELAQWFRKTAHDNGWDQNTVHQAIDLYAKDMLARQPNIEEQMKLLGENGPKRVEDLSLWLKSKVSADNYNALKGFATSAAAVQALEELAAKTSDFRMGGNNTGTSTAGVKTLPEIQNMMRDPRYYDPHRSDPAYRKEVEDHMAAYVASKGR